MAFIRFVSGGGKAKKAYKDAILKARPRPRKKFISTAPAKELYINKKKNATARATWR